jgi:hypothetical protein
MEFNMAKKALLRLIAAAFLIGASLLTVNAVAKNDTNFKEMVTEPMAMRIPYI